MYHCKRRDCGIPYKRDTPVRPATRRRQKNGPQLNESANLKKAGHPGYKKLQTSKRYDTLPEKPEEEEINESTIKPVNLVMVCTSMPFLNSSRFSENRSSKPASGVTSAVKAEGQQKLSVEAYTAVNPTPEVSKSDVTPESETSCIMEADSVLNLDDDDDDDDDGDQIYSSDSTSLSSFASPEIFRKEMSVDMMAFPNKDDFQGPHLHVKNSTLLEYSYAENIHSHHPPNLSTIIDVSTVLAEQKCEISQHKNPEDESKKNISSCKSDQAFERNTPLKLSERKPISYRKKVWFKSPITTEIQRANGMVCSTISAKTTSSSSSIPQKIKCHPMTPTTTVMSFNDESLPLAVKLKIPVKTCSEKEMFFNFVNDGDGQAFFQKMRERSVKLRSAVFFPFKSGMQA